MNKAYLKVEIKKKIERLIRMDTFNYLTESNKVIEEIQDLIDQLDEPKPQLNGKKWLKDKLDKRIGKLPTGYTGSYSEGSRDAYTLVLQDLDQLDEPEKVVVPQFVAEWYEKNIEGGYVTGANKFSGNDVFRVVQDVIKVQNDETTWEDFAVDEKITKFAAENEEVFLHLLVNCSYKDGYTAEEKKYYVKFTDYEHSYLNRLDDGKLIVSDFTEKLCLFTEQEINAIDPRYMAFAEEVQP